MATTALATNTGGDAGRWLRGGVVPARSGTGSWVRTCRTYWLANRAGLIGRVSFTQTVTFDVVVGPETGQMCARRARPGACLRGGPRQQAGAQESDRYASLSVGLGIDAVIPSVRAVGILRHCSGYGQ